MAIVIGTQLGAYQILAPLGKGGMGEVYRAKDTRLDREVAVKVLPTDFAQDADRLRRFEQEAKATSALNHPNILTVHDFGSHEGSPYLVAELLEGEELRDHLQHGALPARKAIEYALQIVAGLAAAHDKGIIHRDLKPENLFITKDGRVKILDFGLAKLTQLRNADFGMRNEEADTLIQGEAPNPQSAIRNPQLTAPGTVMGTVAYMSPEQVRGEVVDARSDLFAFGQILYEMIAGKRAFDGASIPDLMSAILKDEPPELSGANPPLEKLVRRCLEKKPERRFQTASDLGFALEALSSTGYAGFQPAHRDSEPTTTANQQLAPPNRWRERLAWIGLGLVSVLALALGVAYVRRPAMQTPATTMRLSVNPPEGAATFERPVISPDGQMLAFVARTTGTPQIWVRRMDSPVARPLDGTENATQMFWSPDSQSLAFTAGGKLRKIALAGGTPIALYDQPVHSGTWNQDGVILFSARGTGLKRMDANGGNVADVTTIDAAKGESAHFSPFFLPDGRHFLFYVQHNEPAKRGIYVRALEGGQAKQVLNTEVFTIWAGINPAAPGEGWLIFMQQGALLAQSFDFTQHQVSGAPFRLADQVRTTIIGALTGPFSLSNNGVLIFSEGRENQQLVLADRQGQKLQTLGSLGSYSFPGFSPDGQRVAVGRVDPQNQFQDIHLLDLAGGRDIRFTVDPGEDGFPLWSPDGNRIVWGARRGGTRDLFWKATNGAGEEELLWKSPHPKFPMDWSKDGRFIAYSESAPGTNLDVWILPLTGERKAWPWLKTRFAESSARFSPDGKGIAYQTNAPGRNEVFVRAFNLDAPDTGGQWQISTNGGERPYWRNDGRELYYLSADEKLMAVDITLGAEVKAGTPRALFDLRELRAVTANVSYAATGDGQRFLFVTSAEDATLTPFTVVTNWMAGLKK